MVFQKISRKVAFVSSSLFALALSCGSSPIDEMSIAQNSPSPEFKRYWHQGKAEIASYSLQQSRYGELREGEAVLVFVTEPFSKQSNTKADEPSAMNTEVLKCNFTKKFNTGIYPYSIMTSTFSPLSDPLNGLKASCSVQEWCGHAYSELKRSNRLTISTRSYFEGENSEVELKQGLIEDDIWSAIRIDPTQIVMGQQMVVPALHLIRLMHWSLEPYECTVEKTVGLQNSQLTLSFPALSRVLKITYSTTFPHTIESWTDQYPDGFSSNSPIQTTKGVLKKRILAPYWQLNHNSDSKWRDSLQLTGGF